METRKPTAKEPNALQPRLPRKAAALAQGATLLVAAALLAAIPSLFPVGEANAEPDGGALAAAVDGAAAQNGPIVLEPGQPFDLSSASAGSTVFIGTSGTYELHGTTQAHLEIEARGNADITVRLADGTSIAPENSTGNDMSALVINAFAGPNGTPRISIVTEEGAQASLKGANRGSGVSVMVANTNQAAPPATEPVVSFDGESGSTLQVSSDMSTGMALSSAYGPNASTAAVAIAGGTLASTGWGRPAILCGIPLRITGDARVEATCDGEAPAIGNVSGNASVSIEGGSVRAITHENVPGIGSVSGNADVSISGGVVDIRSEGYRYRQADTPAIGSAEGDAAVSVSGGLVITDDLAYGTLVLGSRGGDAEVRISGGTVDVGFGGAGVPQDSDGTGTLAITGGSFTGFAMARGGEPSAHATTGYGTTVYRTFVALEDVASQIAVTSLDIGGSSYGTNDLQTSRVRFQDDVYRSGVMVWLPASGEVAGAVDENGNRYTGEIHPTDMSSPLDYGMLYLSSNLTLDVNTDAGYDGSARVRSGSDEVVMEEAVDPNDDGYALRGFYDKPEGGTLVMDAQYRLLPNIEGWTDAQGRWARTDAPFTLYAQWDRSYTVAFDANAPRTASTTVSGSMTDAELTRGTASTLPACGFALAGYRFAGWNTSADGTGTAYTDGDEVLDLAEGGETATLYAQWVPLTYQVTFEGGEGASGTMPAQTLAFDQAATLDANAFSAPTGAVFAGWRDEATGNLYADQAQAINLCEVNEDGSLAGRTLTAQWARNDVMLTITLDNEPVTLDDPENSLELIPEGGGAAAIGFTPGGSEGTYTLQNVEPGTYYIDINEDGHGGTGLPTGSVAKITVEAGTPTALSLAYATVKIATEGDGIGAWIGSAGVTERIVLVGNTVSIGCGTDAEGGYVFDGWSCRGASPAGLDSSSEETQHVTINGPVTITAHSRSATYTVVFDANGGDGQMAPQTMTCHETHALDPCSFLRDDYAFAGWNTEQDGSGANYADGAEVENLALADGATVTLYAQWAARYTVAFEANAPATASTSVAGSTSALSMIAGQSSNLPACGFALPGYTFDGWNTAANGTGTAYADGAEVVDLATEAGSTVTLHAQWEPLAYTVELLLTDDDGATTSLGSIAATFDAPLTLPEKAEGIPDDAVLLGWETLGLGSFYRTGSQETNLCTLASDGAPVGRSLYALLGTTGEFYLSIEDNGTPVALEDPASEIELVAESGAAFAGFSAIGSGVYSASDIPPGTYSIAIEGWDADGTSAVVAEDGSGMIALAYCTVETTAEAHAEAWLVDPETDEHVEQIERVLVGSVVEVGSSADEGYAFESWTAIGTAPDWEGDDPAQASQTITVNGRVLLEAHPVANRYQVHFDANGGSGTMEPQDMVHGEPQRLFASAFAREGYTFAGWNTAADGSGAAYSDGAEVASLASEDGAAVTLYAQWEPNAYTVRFDANQPASASTQASGSMAGQQLLYGQAAALNECGYALPGYAFAGWNTEANGSGTRYGDGAEVVNLANEAGATVTLYAQWEPLPYRVILHVGEEADEQTRTIDASFDSAVTLSWPESVPDGKSIVGWEGLAFDSFYADGSSVLNLNQLESDGTLANDEIHLYAVLAETGTVYFSITNDGIGVDLDPASIQLSSNGTTIAPFSDSETPGLYIAQGVQPGEFDVIVEGYDRGPSGAGYHRPTLKVASDGSGTYALELFTVRIQSDGHTDALGAIPAFDPEYTTVVRDREWGNNLSIEAFVDDGYSFGGWTCVGATPSNLLPYDSNGQTVTLLGPVTFTAHATPNAYRIAFDANGGSGAMADLEMTYDQAKALPASAFTRPGHSFAGWNTAADGSGTAYADGAEVSNRTTEDGATVTLYAQWEPLPYEVVFYPNGADAGAMDAQLISLDAETPLAANQFARAGHHFVGWNTAADGSGESYADGEAVLNLTDEAGGRVALYAQWEYDSYTIAFDPNGGEGEMAAQTVLANETVKLGQCAFSREGYSFAGWNTAADGTGDAYADGAEVANLASEDGATVTLYAQWDPNAYSVHFDANAPSGASTQIAGSMGDQELLYGKEAALAGCGYSLPGYEFAGWNAAADGSGTAYADGAQVASLTSKAGAVVTLYAQWKPLTYTVTFEGGDGATGSMEPQELAFDEPATLSPNAFENGGAAFAGWSVVGETGSSQLIADGAEVVNLCSLDDEGVPQGLTLRAQWAAEPAPGPGPDPDPDPDPNPDPDPDPNPAPGGPDDADGGSDDGEAASGRLSRTGDAAAPLAAAASAMIIAAGAGAACAWRKRRSNR